MSGTPEQGLETHKDPVIVCPIDFDHKGLLWEKLGQYDAWAREFTALVGHCAAQNNVNLAIDTHQRGYSRRILCELLSEENSRVDTFELSRALLLEQGNNFNEDNFKEACGLVKDYASDIEVLALSIVRFENLRKQ